jgi:hypothetical protein
MGSSSRIHPSKDVPAGGANKWERQLSDPVLVGELRLWLLVEEQSVYWAVFLLFWYCCFLSDELTWLLCVSVVDILGPNGGLLVLLSLNFGIDKFML